MNERIKNHVEGLFANAPRSRRVAELKDELIANLNDRYGDLISKGQDEETAYSVVIAGIGDVDELIRGLRTQEIFDPLQVQMQRQKSALFVSLAVAIYILSFIFPIIFSWIDGYSESSFGFATVIGLVLMFVCWAVATMLLVYNAMSKPKYIKVDDTVVEDFKEWKSVRETRKTLRNSINSLIWMASVVIFLALGMFGGAWSHAWMIFLLAVVATHLVKMLYSLKEDK